MATPPLTSGPTSRRSSPARGPPWIKPASTTVILKKVGGGWKVAYAIYNSDEPPAMPGMK